MGAGTGTTIVTTPTTTPTTAPTTKPTTTTPGGSGCSGASAWVSNIAVRISILTYYFLANVLSFKYVGGNQVTYK
jgi:hypothetical protein